MWGGTGWIRCREGSAKRGMVKDKREGESGKAGKEKGRRKGRGASNSMDDAKKRGS